MRNALIRIDLWDVGQGDCSTIVLPDGRLIIIDVGPRGSPLVDWLNERRGAVPDIAAIILTHNDGDHAGALSAIIREHKRRIGVFWMLMDRNPSNLVFQKIFRIAEEAAKEGCFEIKRVDEGQVLWTSEDGKTVLKIVHPNFIENVQAINSGKPNGSSGLIVLESNSNCLFAWPGDLELNKVAEKLQSTPPWGLFGPHHGGPSDYPTKAVRKKAGKAAGALKQLVRCSVNLIKPQRSFISVGTKNPHNHPRPGYLKLLKQAGSRIVCSQLSRCCDRLHVLKKIPVFQGALALGLRPCRTGVSCRGAMRFYLVDGELIPDEFDTMHQTRVRSLLRPQC